MPPGLVWAGLLLGSVLVVGLALVLRRGWLLVTVRGNSMAPTLSNGERLLARRTRRAPRRGELIVFFTPRPGSNPASPANPDYRVKRVAATSGDPTPSWMSGVSRTDRPADGQIDRHRTVPPGFLVVHGDNARSQDSRHLGYIGAESVVGIVDLHRSRLTRRRSR